MVHVLTTNNENQLIQIHEKSTNYEVLECATTNVVISGVQDIEAINTIPAPQINNDNEFHEECSKRDTKKTKLKKNVSKQQSEDLNEIVVTSTQPKNNKRSAKNNIKTSKPKAKRTVRDVQEVSSTSELVTTNTGNLITFGSAIRLYQNKYF